GPEMSESDARSIRHSLYFSSSVAVAGIAAGGLVLAGWVFGVEVLKSVVLGYATMLPNTALGFIAAGVALGTSGPWRRDGRQRSGGIGRACALLVLLLGAATVSEHWF